MPDNGSEVTKTQATAEAEQRPVLMERLVAQLEGADLGTDTNGNHSEPPTLTAYSLGTHAMPIVPATASRDWMADTDQRFANRCLPLLIANQSGWVLLNTVPFQARWTGGNDKSALTISGDLNAPPPLVSSHFGHGIITWSIPYLFRTPPGYNLLARGPANHPKDGICALEGVVETDWTAATFTMNWKMTRPFTDIRFEEGEPFCMIVPQRRGALEEFQPQISSIKKHPDEEARFTAFSASRRAFLNHAAIRQPGEPAWQKDYFRGRDPDSGNPAPEHQTRLHLKTFGEFPRTVETDMSQG